MPNKKRPASIIIVSFWSLLRIATTVLGLFGALIFGTLALSRNASIPLDNAFFGLWFAVSPSLKLDIVLWIVRIIIFLVLAIGIFLGFDWGRKGFIFASVLALAWALFQFGNTLWSLYQFGNTLNTVFWAMFDYLFMPVDSLIALCLALWYFNKENILVFFEAENRFPNWNWVYSKIDEYPVMLIVSVCLGVFRLLTEGIRLLNLQIPQTFY
jgi:hypothetical protein